MKTTLLSILLFQLSGLVISQECKYYDKEFIDPILNLPVKVQKGIQICKPGNSDIEFFFSTNRCWVHLNLSITRGGLSKEIDFHTRTPLIITFEDLSTITLFPASEYSSGGRFDMSIDIGLAAILTSTQTDNVIYSVSESQLNQLESKPVDKIKYLYSRRNLGAPVADSNAIKVESKEIDINRNAREKIPLLSGCIKSEVNINSDECNKRYREEKMKRESKSAEELLLEKVQQGKNIKEYEINTIGDLNEGDVVKYKTEYGDFVYGIIIEKITKSKVRIKSYISHRSTQEVVENIKNLIKVRLEE